MASVVRREGKRGVTWQVRWRDADHGGAWRSAPFPEVEYGREAEHLARLFAAHATAAGERWPPQWQHDAHTIPSNTSQPAQELHFSAWADMWLANRVGISERQRRSYARTIRDRINPALGEHPLGSVSADHIRSLIRTWELTGRAPATRALWHVVLRSILTDAVTAGHLARDPTAGLQAPQPRPRRVLALTPQEVSLIREQAPRAEDRAVITTLAQTGLRWGELAGLDVRHADILTRRLHVEQSYAMRDANCALTIGVPKTRGSHRSIALPDGVIDVLLPLVAGRAGTEPLFRGPHGRRLRYSTWRNTVWVPAVRAAREQGLANTPRIHDLRHHHASVLLAQGVPMITVSRRLGHDSIATTDRTYAHLMPDSDSTVLAALNRPGRQQATLGEPSMRPDSEMPRP